MILYIARRLGHGLVLLVGVSLLLFLLLQAAPGEFLSDLKLNSQISSQTITGLRAQYGLDQPMPQRYARQLLLPFMGDRSRQSTPAAATVEELRPGAVHPPG